MILKSPCDTAESQGEERLSNMDDNQPKPVEKATINARNKVRIVLVVVIAVVLVILVIALCVIILPDSGEEREGGEVKFGRHGAVASDSYACSNIGIDAMKEGGTAIDAAVAALFCLGLIHPHSSGIGGGGFMLVYERLNKEAKYLDFRETAPGASSVDMFVNRTNASKIGNLSVAVPGEILGMYEAWKSFGKLSWKRLVQPTIDLATNGYQIDEPLSIVLKNYKDSLYKEQGFKEVFYHTDGSPRKQGETIADPVFAKTLTDISENPFSFYNGTIAKEMVKDIQARGGTLTQDDLQNFTVKTRKVLVGSMADDDILYTTSAPSSGSTLIMILNILKGFNFTPDALSSENIVQTWHKIVESFKFGFAYRPFLGDPDFDPTVEASMELQVNATYAEELRKKIWDNTTHDTAYYGGFYETIPDHGTTHLSVLGPRGDAVSVTSTVGYYFGAKIRSYATGIVYNNHMSTYSLPKIAKSYQPKSSKANYIAPGKRSVSTACPTIVVDKNGTVRMVVGGSGGLKITSGVPTVLMNKLWFGLSLTDAISRPRLHHQLHPNNIYFETKPEYRMQQSVMDGLKTLGHKSRGGKKYCAIQGIFRDKSGRIFAMSDPRKTGVAAVY